MKIRIIVLLITAIILSAMPIEAQSYGVNYCHYICNQQYPSVFSPGGIGCHLYCDYYCAQAENQSEALCQDIQDYETGTLLELNQRECRVV